MALIGPDLVSIPTATGGKQDGHTIASLPENLITIPVSGTGDAYAAGSQPASKSMTLDQAYPASGKVA